MGILLIQPFGKFKGHYSMYTRLLTEGLLESRAECEILTFDGFAEDWPSALGIKHIQIAKADSRLVRYLNKCFGQRWPGWFVRTFATACWAFAHSSKYLALHFIDATWMVVFPLWILFGVPRNMVLTIGGAGNTKEVGESISWQRRIREWFDFRALRSWGQRGFKTIVHSEGVCDWLFAKEIANPTVNSLYLIPWGVATHKYVLPSREQARRAIGYAGYTGDVFLFFGHVRPEKGIEDFIKAVRDLPKTFKVLIVGATEPGYVEKIKKAIYAIGWESQFDLRLHFVPFEEVILYYRAANVAMLNYRNFLGASGVLSHALEFKLPVIASDYGQIGDLVGSNAFGILCRPGDVSSLRAAIRAFLQMPEPEREIFCQNMQAYSETNSWEATARKHLRVYSGTHS